MCRRSWSTHPGTAITWLPGRGEAGLALGWEVEGWLASNSVLASLTFIQKDSDDWDFGRLRNLRRSLGFLGSKLVCMTGSP